MIVQALTDNRNRTSAEIKNIFSRNGGSFAEPGAVSWQFERKGIVLVDKAADEDELTLAAADAGAEDVAGPRRHVAGHDAADRAARGAYRDRGGRAIKVKSSDLTMIPTTSVALEQESQAKSVLRLMDALEDHDDVEAVYANFDIPDAVLEAVERMSMKDEREGDRRVDQRWVSGAGLHAAGHRRTASGATTRCRSTAAVRSCSRSTRATTRPGCTRQMCSYRDDFDELEQTGAVLLGISPQDVDSHERWAEKKRLPVPAARRHREEGDRGVRRRRRPVIDVQPFGVRDRPRRASSRFADRKLIGATFVPVDKLVPVLG